MARGLPGGMSLGHALLLAGSRALIATDAAVDDELAVALIPAAITAIADGLEPAEALRQTQRQVVARTGWERFRAFVP